MKDQAVHYSMLVRWSDEDRAYLVTLPESDGSLSNWALATHGETYEAATANGNEVLTMLIEHWLETGRSLLRPRCFADERTSLSRTSA